MKRKYERDRTGKYVIETLIADASDGQCMGVRKTVLPVRRSEPPKRRT